MTDPYAASVRQRLVVKVPEPTGTSIAPWAGRYVWSLNMRGNLMWFARYWTRSGRSKEQR